METIKSFMIRHGSDLRNRWEELFWLLNGLRGKIPMDCVFCDSNHIRQRNLWQTQTKRSADQAQQLEFHGATPGGRNLCLRALELPKLATRSDRNKSANAVLRSVGDFSLSDAVQHLTISLFGS